jgi:hypothetical protein
MVTGGTSKRIGHHGHYVRVFNQLAFSILADVLRGRSGFSLFEVLWLTILN